MTNLRKVTECIAKDGSTYYSAGGDSRFRSKDAAQQAVDAHARFAAVVNREGMTEEERAGAFVAFFAKREEA